MTRDEARAIAIELTNRGDNASYRLEVAAQFEDWLMRPVEEPLLPKEERLAKLRKEVADHLLEDNEIDLSSVKGLMDDTPLTPFGQLLDRAVEALGKSCTCPSCTAARAWRAADGHPADVPAIRTESMLKARNIFAEAVVNMSIGPGLSTEEADRAIMAILRAINE